jgi:fructuronate reductase
MLNATHSMLAYLGALRGYETIAEAVRDDDLAAAARELLSADVVPTLTPPDGLDLTAYGESVLDRFANPALKHRTTQVAMDGSVKLPVRLLGTVQDRLTAGAEPHSASLAVAGWMVYVARSATVDDPQADRLKSATADATTPAALVDALLAVETVFPEPLRDNQTFRNLLIDHVGTLTA